MSQRLFPFHNTDEDQRLFPFHGTDKEYIQFLEFQVISTHWAGQGVGHTGFPMPPRPEITNESAPTHEIEIVQYKPDQSSKNSQASEQAKQRWKNELNVFISALPREGKLRDARQKAGIDTPRKNQLALRLMLGHANSAVSRLVKGDALQPPVLVTENNDLVKRGYVYAGYIQSCAGNLSFTESVVSFQGLIFVSYCLVMMGTGISKETTNDMMRRYIVRHNDDTTLERYRRGVAWIHRCIAELLVNGWGYMSWEFFLLEKRSLARFARIATGDATSYKALVEHLGEANLPQQSKGWIPYCIPCIVQSLAGGTIGLERICDILDYNAEAKSKIRSLSESFYHSLQNLATP